MKQYIALPILFLLMACNTNVDDKQATSGLLTDKMNQLITSTEAIATKGEQVMRLNGKVTAAADARIEIPAMVSGRVAKVAVRRGETVRKGDLLAIISSNEVTELHSELTAAQSDLSREQKEYEAAEALFTDGLLSKQEMAAAEGELKVAKAEVKRIEKQLAILGNNGAAEYHITSPINGMVEQRGIHTNAYISEDFDEPMFTITNLDQVIVNLLISESNIRYIKEGLPVKMRSLSYPDKDLEGQITRVVRVLDPESKVMHAKVIIENDAHLLLPEMFVQSEVSIMSDDELVAIPSSALIFDESRHYLVCEKANGQYENREVEVWGRNGQQTYISKGIQAGERIVSQYPLLVFTEIQNNEKYGQ